MDLSEVVSQGQPIQAGSAPAASSTRPVANEQPEPTAAALDVAIPVQSAVEELIALGEAALADAQSHIGDEAATVEERDLLESSLMPLQQDAVLTSLKDPALNLLIPSTPMDQDPLLADLPETAVGVVKQGPVTPPHALSRAGPSSSTLGVIHDKGVQSSMTNNGVADNAGGAETGSTKDNISLIDVPIHNDDPMDIFPGSALRSPIAPASSSISDGRQLNVTDALGYLDAVKHQFQDRPDVYNHFLDIMKDFKSQIIDTPGVIDRVSALFSGHPNLIQGFNTFLPVGYRIECSIDPNNANLILVTTPSGSITHNIAGGLGSYFTPGPPQMPLPGPHEAGLLSDGIQYTAEQISPAIAYVTKIKQRFADHTDLYQEFLDILDLYKKGPPVDEGQLANRIANLFQNAPDLLSDFQVFMPQGILPNAEVFSAIEAHSADREKPEKPGKKRALEAQSSAVATSPPKRRRRQNEREKEKEREKERERELAAKASSSKPSKKAKHRTTTASVSPYPQHRTPPMPHRTHTQLPTSQQPAFHQPPPIDTSLTDETLFFDRVRRMLDSRETYNEFLKLLNLFTQEFIDMRTLVEQAYSFLGDTDLMALFKDIMGWDDRRENDRFLALQAAEAYASSGRPGSALGRASRADMHIRNGPSYRRLPANEVNVPCSGRDDMCRSVLNDEWVSHPTFASEDSGFVSHRKNAYEEALHRSEEERHEYDFHIEAITRTITMLEPIHNKILTMSPEERNSFKLKANFGGTSKSIHQRIIKKIYGREAGMEVVQAMHDAPSVAIPLVLQRLKQKEEEWKRAQREWNKVWREVDARNYQKSLDHQGVIFKSNDKKATTTKAFVSQVEAAKEEQMARRASLIDPTFARTRSKHQLSFVIEDMAVLQDVLKLTFSFLDRMQSQITAAERKRIENFLRFFVPTFFMRNPAVFNANVTPPSDGWDTDVNFMDDFTSIFENVDETVVTQTSARGGRNGRRSQGNDLRKKLLKNNTQERSTSSRKIRAGASSGANSRRASPTPSVERMKVDEQLTSPLDGPVSTSAAESDAQSSDTANMQHGKPSRRGVFFANTASYALLRLIEVLHSRLLSCKQIAAKLASDTSDPSFSNTLASKLAILDSAPPDTGLADVQKQTNPASHFYEYLLESCEKLFDNEVDQSTFEEVARYMFGTKAYVMFTVDKVIGGIIKQVQNLLEDPKAVDIVENLKRERELSTATADDIASLRRNVESLVGPEELTFRICWIPESTIMTVQLLDKEDSEPDDLEVITGRWQSYVDSYVSDAVTSGVATLNSRPSFLKRNLKLAASWPAQATEARGYSGLEIKVCVRTYRLFFVSDTEDILWREQPSSDREQELQRAAKCTESKARWLIRLDTTGSLPHRRT